MRASSVQRRQQILDAALACFDEMGYEPATLHHIRARSGASIGSIYHHFGSKEQIAAALYLDAIGSYHEALTSVPAEDAEAWVRGIVASHLRWCKTHAPLARFIDSRPELEAALAIEEAVAELNRGLTSALRAAVVPLQRSGAIVDLPLELSAAIIIGPAHALSRRWLAGAGDVSLRTAEKSLAEAAWRAVRRAA